MNVIRLQPRRERPKQPKSGESRTQRAHRQIAWALYITEGYAANMRHALDFNSYDCDGKQKAQMREAIAAAEIQAIKLRRMQ